MSKAQEERTSRKKALSLLADIEISQDIELQFAARMIRAALFPSSLAPLREKLADTLQDYLEAKNEEERARLAQSIRELKRRLHAH